MPQFDYKTVAQNIVNDLNGKTNSQKIESIKAFIHVRFIANEKTTAFLPTLVHHIDSELFKQKITSRRFTETEPPRNISAEIEAKAIISGKQKLSTEEMTSYVMSILSTAGEHAQYAAQIAALLLFSVGVKAYDVADVATKKTISYLFPQRERLPSSYDGFELVDRLSPCRHDSAVLTPKA